MMTKDVISRVKALGQAQKQPIMHDEPIIRWKNGDPIAPAVISDDGVDAGVDVDVTPDPPLFLPLPTLPLGLDEIDVAMVAPLQVVLVNIGADDARSASSTSRR